MTEIIAFPMGGEYSSFSLDKGNYHVVVSDASYGEASTGRQQLQVDLIVKGDPNHPAKEGKKLTRLFQSLPANTDDIEKQKQLKGFMKNMIYDGFGLKWPEVGHEKPLDPRVLVGKEAWVQVTADKAGKNKITSIAQTQETLPKKVFDAPVGAGGANPTAGTNGAAARRRR